MLIHMPDGRTEIGVGYWRVIESASADQMCAVISVQLAKYPDIVSVSFTYDEVRELFDEVMRDARSYHRRK